MASGTLNGRVLDLDVLSSPAYPNGVLLYSGLDDCRSSDLRLGRGGGVTLGGGGLANRQLEAGLDMLSCESDLLLMAFKIP